MGDVNVNSRSGLPCRYSYLCKADNFNTLDTFAIQEFEVLQGVQIFNATFQLG